jgi:hypothetical protein
MDQTAMMGLQSNQQNYQQCFIGHSQGASWRQTFEQVCEEVLPKFDLKPWYANKQYQGSVPLRQKVVNMIATTCYGIYDLSYWRENDHSPWIMPRNVLIELGMAIALNRPMLLLRHCENRECSLTLPTCLEGIAIGEFGDGKKVLKDTLNACLPSLTEHTPEKDWLDRYCHFGGLECPYREAHPQARQWGRQKIHIHVSDGANAAHIDCSDFHDMIEEDVLNCFNNLEFTYLDNLTCPQGCKFLLCSHCQEVRSSPFAIYRITPYTSADTFIAIGMSIALEKRFGYDITKILITSDENNIPSLLKGYEIIVERSYTKIKDRLKAILPEMIEKTRETTWKPQSLPFEVFLPTREYIESEETPSIEAYSENDTQAQRDEDNSSQQETERDQDIDQIGREQIGSEFDKFTRRVRKVLNLAQEEARRFQHNYIGTEHLLLALVREGEGVAAKVLADLYIELNTVRISVGFSMGRGDHPVLGEVGLTRRANKVIELADDESRRLNHQYIGTEHLLLGLVREGEGIAAGVLESLGVTLEKARTQTIQVLSRASTPANTAIDKEAARNIQLQLRKVAEQLLPSGVFLKSYHYQEEQSLLQIICTSGITQEQRLRMKTKFRERVGDSYTLGISPMLRPSNIPSEDQ